MKGVKKDKNVFLNKLKEAVLMIGEAHRGWVNFTVKAVFSVSIAVIVGMFLNDYIGYAFFKMGWPDSADYAFAITLLFVIMYLLRKLPERPAIFYECPKCGEESEQS